MADSLISRRRYGVFSNIYLPKGGEMNAGQICALVVLVILIGFISIAILYNQYKMRGR